MGTMSYKLFYTDLIGDGFLNIKHISVMALTSPFFKTITQAPTPTSVRDKL